MIFQYIEPEVSGGLGEETILDNSVHPPIVKKLHFEFDGWLEDDIIESFPCYLITERLKTEIEKRNLSGISFDTLTTSISNTFKKIYGDKKLPKFHWLKISGKAGIEDFGLAEDLRLVISKKALETLELFNLKNADFEDY